MSAQFALSDTINGTGWKGTTQSGGVGQFSSAGNWDSTGPGAGERNLFFGDAWSDPAKGNRTGATTANNDLASQNLYRITFQPAHAGSGADQTFTLTGNALNLFDFGGNFPKIENTSSVNQIINNNIALNGTNGGGKGELNPTGGDLTLNGTVALNGTTALQVFGGSGHTLTFNGVLSGSNTVTDQTNNIVLYNAANTYTGDTFILAGKVQFGTNGSANSSTLRLGDTTGSANAEIDLLGGASGGVNVGSIINPRAGSTGTLTIASQNTGGTNTLSNHIGADKNFTISQTGGGTLNYTQARSSVSSTTTGFDIKNFTVTLTGAGNFNFGAASPTAFGTIYDSTSGGSGTAIIMQGTGSLTLSDQNSYRGKTEIDSGTLFIASNNALGSSNGTIGTIGNTVLLGNTTGSSNASLLTTGAFTVANVITFQSGNTGTMTLGGNSANASIYSGAINLGTASGTAQNGTFVALAGGSVDFQGVIDENTSVPASGVTIGDATHSGTIKFSNTANGYGGTTTITNGATLEVTSLGTAGNSSIGNSARSTASNLVLSNGTLKYTGAGETTTRSFTFDANGGALDASAAANAALIYTGTAAASGTGNRTLTLTGASTGANALQLVLANPSSGATALTKTGTGTWQLTGSSGNTYTGITTVSNGELDLSKSSGNAIGGNLTINGGTVKWLASNQVSDSSMITLSSGTLNLNGQSETVTDLNNAGGNFFTGAGTWTGLGASMTWGGGTNTVNTGGTVFDNHLTITAGTNEVQAGGLVQLSLTGLTMNGGTVTLDSDPTNPGKLSLMSNVGANDGTTSNINTSSATNPGVVSLNGAARTFTIGSSNAATTLNISASIQGASGAIVKNGPGTLVLTGNNTFTGATTINAGKLNAGATGALGSTSSVAVNSGGTLLLSGSGNLNRVNDSAGITLNAGTLARTGTASEGSGAHSVGGVVQSGSSATGLGALTLSSSSTLDFGASGVGTLVFSSFSRTAGVLNILNYTTTADAGPQTSGTDGTDDRLIFNQDQASNLAFFSFNGLSAYEIALSNGFFELTPIPEPGTWAAGALAFTGLLLSQRRRIARLVKR